MASKLKLKQDATFKSVVPVVLPGGEAVDVTFEFKNRTREELKQFYADLAGADELDAMDLDQDTDFVMSYLVGWDIEEAFTRDNLKILLDNYPFVGADAVKVYLREINGARTKN